MLSNTNAFIIPASPPEIFRQPFTGLPFFSLWPAYLTWPMSVLYGLVPGVVIDGVFGRYLFRPTAVERVEGFSVARGDKVPRGGAEGRCGEYQQNGDCGG